jgi:hypothetical protein
VIETLNCWSGNFNTKKTPHRALWLNDGAFYFFSAPAIITGVFIRRNSLLALEAHSSIKQDTCVFDLTAQLMRCNGFTLAWTRN